MIRRRLTGLLACVVIVAILVGLPIVLLTVGGNPIPDRWPTIGRIAGWLTRPDDGSLALEAICLAGWIVWLLLGATIISEIIASVRGITIPTAPAFKAPQLAVRQLVAAAALLFLSAQALSSVPMAHGDDTSTPPTPAAAQAAGRPADISSERPKDVTVSLIDHIVEPADTLSGLARTYLGDADRWPEIFDASVDIVQSDGQRLANPDLIRDGWTLKIPVTMVSNSDAHQVIEHRVGPADTLSGLAQTYLGDASRWPEIFAASCDVIQPDGEQLTDPDVLLIGWRLHIPVTAPGAVEGTPPATEESDNPVWSPTSDIPTDPPRSEPSPAEEPAQSSTVDSGMPQQPGAPQIPQADAAPAPSGQDSTDVGADELAAPWLLTGLSTGGLVLAAGALLAMRSRRRQQFRERRPGRAIATPNPPLAPVEKTVTTVGTPAISTVRHMDDALRHLAVTMIADHRPMPAVNAVQLRADGVLVLHLASPAQLAEPWTMSDPDQLIWQLAADSSAAANHNRSAGQPAPYPLLVTCGSSDTGDVWLVNLEQLATVRVVGDPDFRSDYLRYVVAELALNRWSANTSIACAGLDDLTAINPERIHLVESLAEASRRLHDSAIGAATLAAGLDQDTTTARASQAGEEVWAAQVLVADGDHASDEHGFAALVDVIRTHQGRTATAIVTSTPIPDPIEFDFTSTGRIKVDVLGLDLIAVGLTRDEAVGCAALLAVGAAARDTAMPVGEATDGWQALADQAGALREDLTVPRSTRDSGPSTSLIAADAPLPVSAVEADLEVLDPKVPAHVRSVVEQADPGLDQDLTDWRSDDCARPRLALLGPVTVRAHCAAIAKRKPFYTEVLSYLALREHGATPDELATALGYTNLTTVRTAVKTVRDWLGTNPRNGRPHLPAATESPAAKLRGVPVYQVEDLLMDVDLFRRLRLRGQACGTDGVDDTVAALGLVTGRPFDRLRPGGWSWLADTGMDHHMICAIVDTAHLLTIHFLQTGQLDRAQAATETSLLAAPYDEIPKLDMAAILQAQGHNEQSRHLIDQDICNAEDDDGLPAEIGQRTEQVLDQGDWDWMRRRTVAS